ncbi:MAG: BamA/TamA family outer membrane protein [Candidatus Zixiibacteriota bacterium]|nr:MAG: BamA/TamA family outer membrane protein [candidate division Zixibacteria bacterium]
MNVLLAVITVILVTITASGANIVFEGTPPDNPKTVAGYARRYPNPDSLAAFLVREGYLDAAVRRDSTRLVVDAGQRCRIGQIKWLGDTGSTRLAAIPFTQRNLEQSIEDRLAPLRDSGYYYCTAAVISISRRGSEIFPVVRLTPGPRLILKSSLFSGLTRTSPQLVARYIPIESGDTLTERKLEAAEKAAAAVPFVNFTPPLMLKPRAGYTDTDLEFVFVEKKQAVIAGGGGYVPEAPSSFVWHLDLAFQNLFGRGRQIRIKSEKREADRQVLDIGYTQPVFLIGTGSAGGRVATRDYRGRFYEFALSAHYRARFSPGFSASLGLSWRRVEPEGNFPSFSSFASAVTVARDNLDDSLNPSGGLSIDWTIEFSYRRYLSDSLSAQSAKSSFNETRNRLAASWFRPLVSNLIAHVGVGYVGFETSEPLPPVSELYYIGGPGTIRGYRNEQFTALRSAYGTVEPRLRFTSGYLFAFYDAAYINNRIIGAGGGVETDEFYRCGYGLGGAVIDRARSVRLSLAWNPDSPFDQPRLSIEFSSEI